MTKEKFSKKIKNPSVMYVGIDIAKDRHCARGYKDKSNQTKHIYFKNNKEGFEVLIETIKKWLKKLECNEIILAMEPTAGYWEPLFYYLKDNGFNVKFVPSIKVKRVKDLRDNSPLKSDPKDALIIAELAYQGHTVEIDREDQKTLEIKKLLKTVEDFEKTMSFYRNHLEYHISVHFPELKEIFKNLYTVTARKFLKRFPFPADIIKLGRKEFKRMFGEISKGNIKKSSDYIFNLAQESIGVKEENESVRFIVMSMFELIEIVEDKLNTTKKLMEEKVEKIESYEIIRSVKGAGVMTSAAIIGVLGDVKNYKNSRQVLKKAGLNLYNFSSGKYKSGHHISKRGMSLLRKYLFMCALSNTRYGSVFYDKYSSLINNGVKKIKAIVAIMRKILKLIYALVRDGRKFEPVLNVAGAKRDGLVIMQTAA